MHLRKLILLARAVAVQKKPYKGLEFAELEKLEVPVVATFAISPTEKFVMRGTLTVDLHSKSYAFPNEAVLTVWSREFPVVEKRAENDGYARLEIPVEARKAYEFLMSVCCKLDARLKGII